MLERAKVFTQDTGYVAGEGHGAGNAHGVFPDGRFWRKIFFPFDLDVFKKPDELYPLVRG